MYQEIDELVKAIKKDRLYQEFIEKEKTLQCPQVVMLLQQNQQLQEEYIRLKQYTPYISLDETKDKLKTIKRALTENQDIQEYYQSYYQLNDLLEDVTRVVFQNISSEIAFERWK